MDNKQTNKQEDLNYYMRDNKVRSYENLPDLEKQDLFKLAQNCFPDERFFLTLPKIIQNDEDFVLIAAKENINILKYISMELQNDYELAKKIISYDGTAIFYFSESLKKDERLGFISVNESGYGIAVCSDNIQNNPYMVALAIQNINKETNGYNAEVIKESVFSQLFNYKQLFIDDFFNEFITDLDITYIKYIPDNKLTSNLVNKAKALVPEAIQEILETHTLSPYTQEQNRKKLNNLKMILQKIEDFEMKKVQISLKKLHSKI